MIESNFDVGTKSSMTSTEKLLFKVVDLWKSGSKFVPRNLFAVWQTAHAPSVIKSREIARTRWKTHVGITDERHQFGCVGGHHGNAVGNRLVTGARRFQGFNVDFQHLRDQPIVDVFGAFHQSSDQLVTVNLRMVELIF